MTQKELDQRRILRSLRRTRHGRWLAQETMKSDIRAAHHFGVSLRKIADAAGVSHETVRRIVSSEDQPAS